MRPSECCQCMRHFMDRPLLQAELRHIAVKYGESAARAELNERLEETHMEHERKI